MAVIPMSVNQKIPQSRTTTISPSSKGLSVLHQPADHTSLRSIPFVCVGQELSIIYNELQFCISGVFLSPAGDVSIVLKERPSSPELQHIIEYLGEWDYDGLDSISSDYTYLNSGQAYRIIDIMANHGHLKFSGVKALSDAVNRNMKDGSFYLLCADGAI